MKRKSLRTLVCALLASLALTTFAFADSGPKPLLIVRVKDAPQEPYYLDLLAEGNWDASEGNNRLKQSTVITNSDGSETTVPLNEDLLALLLDNIPAGWHACTAQGTFGAPIFSHLFSRGTDASGNALHRFGYVGVPSTYRIILVTESGKVWVSDILNRRVLQSSVTVNWSDDTSAVTVSVPSTIPGYLLQFVATLVPTFLIEGALLLLFRYSWKKNWEAFLLVNVLTQGFLAVASVSVTAHSGVSAWYFFFFLLPAELIICLSSCISTPAAAFSPATARAAPRPMRSRPIWLPLFSAIIWPSLSGGSLSRSYDSVHITPRRNSHDRPSLS